MPVKVPTLFLVSALISSFLQGALIVQETFDSLSGTLEGESTTIYNNDGSVAGSVPWAQGSKGDVPSVTGGSMSVNSGALVVASNGSDTGLSLNLTATDVTLTGDTQVLYYGFRLTVTGPLTNDDYIAAFSSTQTGNHRERLHIETGASGQFQLNIDGETPGTPQLNQNQTYTIIVEDVIGSDVSNVYVDNAAGDTVFASGSRSDRDNNYFQFSVDALVPGYTVDNLAVGTTYSEVYTFVTIPEPNSLALTSVALLGIIIFLRRRT